jgi:hypothetical protein
MHVQQRNIHKISKPPNKYRFFENTSQPSNPKLLNGKRKRDIKMHRVMFFFILGKYRCKFAYVYIKHNEPPSAR